MNVPTSCMFPLKINASEIITNECIQITNLVLCISVLNGCFVFGNLIHLPKDTLNASGKSNYGDCVRSTVLDTF